MASRTRMTGSLPVAAAANEGRPASFLDTIELSKLQAADRYMPTLSVAQFSDRQKMLEQLKEMLVPEIDYGALEGKDKPVLLKPGAEKICAFFGYAPAYELVRVIEQWDQQGHYDEPLFYYNYRCILKKGGEPVGEGIGSANSWESKYRYRWMNEAQARKQFYADDLEKFQTREGGLFEFEFAIEKAETTGQYGKPAAYWQQFKDAIADGTAVPTRKATKKGTEYQGYTIGGLQYRVPNPDIADIVNTVDKMAQKRAYIASTLSATGASQFFTQDLEPEAETSEQVAERRINEEKQKAANKQSTGQTAKQPDSQTAAQQSTAAPAGLQKYKLQDLTKGQALKAAQDRVFTALCDLSGSEDRANAAWQQALTDYDIPSTGPVPAVRMMDMLNHLIDGINEVANAHKS